MIEIQNYINGKTTPPIGGVYLDDFEPATGQVYAQCPDSGVEDLNMAVDAAERAKDGWATTPAEQRSAILSRLANLIDAHADDLAKAEATDNGKPITFTKNVDIYRAAANIRFFAQAITQFSSESHGMENTAINYTLRDPIGIVACISPWNFPLYLFTWKIAPALATGNCVIAKPSEVTPMTAFLFSKLCIEAGLPAGVLNVLHGSGAQIGAAITEHPAIKAISFFPGPRVAFVEDATELTGDIVAKALEDWQEGDAVIISSYASEQEIFDSLQWLRDKGVKTLRLHNIVDSKAH